jgi:dihydropyrimidinase
LRDGVLAETRTGRFLRREHSGATALAAAENEGAA